MVLFPHPFYFVFDISSLLSYIQNNFSYELARPIMGTIFLVIPVLLVGFYRTILTLSMRAFGPRISAYAFWTTTDIHTYIPTDIPREISIEHPSVGLASLAQLMDIRQYASKWISGNFQPGSSETQKGGFERTSSNPTGSATALRGKNQRDCICR